MSQSNGRTKPRAREHTTASVKTKPSNTTIRLSILNGPDRSELYHESEFCLDGDSGPTFRTKFKVRENPYTGYTISACVIGIEHKSESTHILKLHGKVHFSFTGTRTSGTYPFTATYDTQHHTGTLYIKVPLTDLPPN